MRRPVLQYPCKRAPGPRLLLHMNQRLVREFGQTLRVRLCCAPRDARTRMIAYPSKPAEKTAAHDRCPMKSCLRTSWICAMSSHAEAYAAIFGSAAVAARSFCSSFSLAAKNSGSSNAACRPKIALNCSRRRTSLLWPREPAPAHAFGTPPVVRGTPRLGHRRGELRVAQDASCDIVSSRLVPPGLPATKTRSPSFEPLALQRKYSGWRPACRFRRRELYRYRNRSAGN